MDGLPYSPAVRDAVTRAEKCAIFRDDLKISCIRHNKRIKEVAVESGVKYYSFLDTMSGKISGHEIIPKVSEYMKAKETLAQNQTGA